MDRKVWVVWWKLSNGDWVGFRGNAIHVFQRFSMLWEAGVRSIRLRRTGVNAE